MVEQSTIFINKTKGSFSHKTVPHTCVILLYIFTVPARKNEKSHLARAKNKAYSSWG